MDKKELESYKKAGEIAVKVRKFIKQLVKPEMPLVEIAQKIEKEIERLGGKCAFPVNLSIDDIAAHNHPALESDEVASGVLKVDIGIHVNGFIADTALTLDLTPDNRYKELINASEEALESALKLIKKNPDISLNDIGSEIKKTIEKKGFSPIVNLSGHSLGEYQIHAGVTIPNYANGNQNKLEEGAYAIEPFATTGEGRIYEGDSGNVYTVIKPKNPRSPKAKEIFDYIWKTHKTLPFSLREIQEKFGNFARLSLKELENSGIIRSYSKLIDKTHGIVSQAEHTFIKKEGKIIILSK